MQTVFYHISSHSITESVKEVGTYSNQSQNNPRLVLKQIAKLLEREFLSSYGLQSLLGHQSASQSSSGCDYSKEHAKHCVLMLLCSAYQSLQIRERQQSDESHCIGSHHTETRELVLLVVIVGHHAQQRSVRHVHSSIHSHHQQIQAVSPYALACKSEVGGVEQQSEHQSEGNGSEYQPRAIGSPLALCAIGQRSHQRVGNHVKHTRDEHQRCCIGKGKSKHICKEQREGYRHDFPCDTSSSCIA